jgi:hypothetical protein
MYPLFQMPSYCTHIERSQRKVSIRHSEVSVHVSLCFWKSSKSPVDSACLWLLIPETSFPASAHKWFGVHRCALGEWVASYLHPRSVGAYSRDTFGHDNRHCVKKNSTRLCGLVARVPGYRSRFQGSIPGATRFYEN